MWIRSQDIKRLIDANNIGVDRNMVFHNNGLNCTPLGVYPSEERALGVLDEIHDQLINATQCDIIVNGERITKLAVYQMPIK